MKIVITGGAGYVGTLLTNTLLKFGYEVVVVDTMWFGDYLIKHENLKVIKKNILEVEESIFQGCESIIHLANIANDPCGELDSKLSWEVNVLASMQLVEKAIRQGVKQFIYASSGSVYGVSEAPKVTEDLDLLPISDYNKTKMISERVLLSYKDKIKFTSIRPATVCGYSPRMRLDVSVNMLTMQALKNRKITVFGGKQVRPNINIKDMVGLYKFTLENPDAMEGVFNAGFENISILDIANRVVEKVPAEIIVTESNDPRSYRLNSDKLLATGFKPQFSVGDAIDEIVELFQKGILEDKEDYYNLKMMKKFI